MVGFSQAKVVALAEAAQAGGIVDLVSADGTGGALWHAALAGGEGLIALHEDPVHGLSVGALLRLASMSQARVAQPALMPLTGPEGHGLILMGQAGAGPARIGIDPAGAAYHAQQLGLPEGLGVPRVGVDLGISNLAGQRLLAFGTAEGRVGILAIDPNGRLTLCADVPVAADARASGLLGSPAALGVLRSDGAAHLVVTVPGADRILAYRIAPDGSAMLTDRTGAPEGLSVAAPAALATVSNAAGDFAIVAARASSTLAVLSLDAQGAFVVHDQIMDSPQMRIGAVSQVHSLTVGEVTVVLAGGGDSGLSLFALGPLGRLHHLATTEAAPGAEFGTLSALDAVADGTLLRIVAAGQGQGAVTVLSADLSGLGVVAAGSAALQPTGRADILQATAEVRDLRGGAGADLFVFTPQAADDLGRLGEVLDFNRAEDRLDLSSFPLLHDASQITIAPTASGADLHFRGLQLRLTSDDGQPLTSADLGNEVLFDALRVPFLPTEPETVDAWLASLPPPANEGGARTGFFTLQPAGRSQAPEPQSWQAGLDGPVRLPDPAETSQILGYFDLIL